MTAGSSVHPPPDDGGPVIAARDRLELRVDQMRRRQVAHDIRHQLSTVVLLTSALSMSTGVDADGRTRLTQLLQETRWLAELFRLYDQAIGSSGTPRAGAEGETRLDIVVVDVLRPIRMSSDCDISLEARPVTAALVHRLGVWRAVRNLVDNALAAAGPDGRVLVRVFGADGKAVVEVHDSGPGFEADAVPTGESLGLSIVRSFVRSNAGRMTIGRGVLGGCVVRLELPERL